MKRAVTEQPNGNSTTPMRTSHVGAPKSRLTEGPQSLGSRVRGLGETKRSSYMYIHINMYTSVPLFEGLVGLA